MTEQKLQDINAYQAPSINPKVLLRILGWSILSVVSAIVCSLAGITIFIALCLTQGFERIDDLTYELTAITPFEAWTILAPMTALIAFIVFSPLVFIIAPTIFSMTKKLSGKNRTMTRLSSYALCGSIFGFLGYSFFMSEIKSEVGAILPQFFGIPIGAICGLVGYFIMAKYGSKFDIQQEQTQ